MIWIALKTYPQRELRLHGPMAEAWSAYTFTPVERVEDKARTRREGKKALRDKCYLPGMAFARLEAIPKWHEFFSWGKSRGLFYDAIRVSGGSPAILHPDDLTALHKMRSRDMTMQEKAKMAALLSAGDTATILGGPLSGQAVEIIEVAGTKATFKLRLFDSDRLVEADIASLRKVG